MAPKPDNTDAHRRIAEYLTSANRIDKARHISGRCDKSTCLYCEVDAIVAAMHDALSARISSRHVASMFGRKPPQSARPR